jgi:flagellar biosynthetic protein FlhB
MRLLKSMVPVAVLGMVAWHRLMSQAELPPFSMQRVVVLATDAKTLLMTAAAVLFAWALGDYLVERWRWEERIKMSTQEMKQESREQQGSPEVKGRIRNLQRQMRRRKLRGDVAKAAVVVTNPTHYAVALEFDFECMDAPKVLAKGRNLMAAEIREEAKWAGVPIVENPPLARSLYRRVETGEQIPAELYEAVATILAWIYRMKLEEEQRAKREAQTRVVNQQNWAQDNAALLELRRNTDGEFGRSGELR